MCSRTEWRKPEGKCALSREKRIASRKRGFWHPRVTEVVHAKRGKRRNSEAATSSRLYEKRERKDRIFGSSLERARNGSPEARARTRFRKGKEKRETRKLDSHLEKCTREKEAVFNDIFVDQRTV